MASSHVGSKMIQKITARVFCQQTGGGNPVTVFQSAGAGAALSLPVQSHLAQSCDWESVCVHTNNNNTGTSTNEKPSMAFYMPTGEQVSFCAHAAMGAALQLATTSVDATAGAPAGQQQQQHKQSLQFTTQLQPETIYDAVVHEHDIVSLDMKADFAETPLPHAPALHRLLRDCCGLESADLIPAEHLEYRPFSFVNSSIARRKTMVYVNSLEKLHAAKPPPTSAADSFRNSCDALDSTGLYLYTTTAADNNNTYECRQFPRASGYPEDPATGIAAAALAVSLHSRSSYAAAAAAAAAAANTTTNDDDNDAASYRFYQGTAMGQASLILVENIVLNQDNDQASFRLLGRVEVDTVESIEIPDIDV